MNKAVFLDRDGVINKNVYYKSTGEWESPRTLAEFQLIDGAIGALKQIQNAGYLLFIVTNQPSYAKGKTTLEELKSINQNLLGVLLSHNIIIKKLYVSYSHSNSVIPELAVEDKYRKPSPQALLEAAKEFNIDLSQSWMVGDRETDVECGIRAGAKTIQITPDYETTLKINSKATHNCLNIKDAASIITSQL